VEPLNTTRSFVVELASRRTPHSGLKRPKSWPKVEKGSDMIEILYIMVFGVAEFEIEVKSQKFKMA
jgi:hypothetical protein